MHKVTHEVICDVCGKVITADGCDYIMHSFLKIQNYYDEYNKSKLPKEPYIPTDILSEHTCEECSAKIEKYIKSIKENKK